MNLIHPDSRRTYAILTLLVAFNALGARIAAAQAVPLSGPVLEQHHPRYTLKPQDVLLLSFPLSPELNQTVTILPDGYITLQSAGSLLAQGLTSSELAAEVKKAYVGILHDPIVDIDIQDFHKPFFLVSGQVGKPGQYDLKSDITVADALAIAGGMTMTTAKTQVLVFHRNSKDWVEVKQVNLKEILKGKNVNEDIMIQPGDMVYVPEKFIANFRKYVPYSVNFGSYLQGPIQ